MRDLFNTNDKVNKLVKFKPPNLRSMHDRRRMLRDRIQGGVDDKSLIMKGIVDPLTIPRIETALNQIEDFAVLTEGAKPQTELDKSRIAMKFLDLCEKPETFKFYGRFDQGYEAKLIDKNTSKEYLRAQQEIEKIKEQRDKTDRVVIRNAVKCKKVGTEKCFPEDSPPKEKPLISESLKKKLSKYRIQQSHRNNVNRSLFTVTSEEDDGSCLPHIDSGGFDSRNQHGPPPQTSQPNQFDSLMSSEGSVMSGTGKPRS